MNSQIKALKDAYFHLTQAISYSSQNVTSQILVDAIAMRISAAIEALNRLDDSDKNRLFADWPAMWGMRNRIAHGYVLVDAGIILATSKIDLPELARVIETELKAQHEQS